MERAKLMGKMLLILYAPMKAAHYYSYEGDIKIEIEWNRFYLCGWICH